MIRNKYPFILTALSFLLAPLGAHTQNDSANDFHYAVHRIYAPISLASDALREAMTVADLNPYFKESWIREYVSVEMTAQHNTIESKAWSKNGLLSREQKDLMTSADTGSEISIVVRYIPENSLSQNDAKEFPFSFSITPENEAVHPGGKVALMEYIKKTAIDAIPEGVFTGYGMAAVKFTIDPEGRVADVHLFWSSGDEAVDGLLLETVCNMPGWTPASYANGTKIPQQFVLIVGHPESCVMPLLNIRRNNLAQKN